MWVRGKLCCSGARRVWFRLFLVALDVRIVEKVRGCRKSFKCCWLGYRYRRRGTGKPRSPLDFLIEEIRVRDCTTADLSRSTSGTEERAPEERRAAEEGGATPTTASATENPGNRLAGLAPRCRSTLLVDGRLFDGFSDECALVLSRVLIP